VAHLGPVEVDDEAGAGAEDVVGVEEHVEACTNVVENTYTVGRGQIADQEYTDKLTTPSD
jgi:hypothetical protein